MKLSAITKVSELFDIMDWNLDGHGLIVTDGKLLSEAIAYTFPDLEDDMATDSITQANSEYLRHEE